MAKSPETSGSRSGNEDSVTSSSGEVHSIERWGVQSLGDWFVSPDYAVELRRRYEQAYPGQHLEGEQFIDWLKTVGEGDFLYDLSPDQQEELRRQYDQPFPGQNVVDPPPGAAAPESLPGAVPPHDPDDPLRT